MGKYKFILAAMLAMTFALNTYGQTAKERGLNYLSEELLKGHLEFLASDWFEGREAGKKGAFMASDYIASQFQIMGLEPYGGKYFHDFSFVASKINKEQKLSLVRKNGNLKEELEFDYQIDFRLEKALVNKRIQAPIVFVGYGIANEEKKFNDYKGVDVKGKIVLMVKGYPGHSSLDSKAKSLFNFSSKRELRDLYKKKIDAVKKKGAMGILIVDPKEDQSARATNGKFHYKYGDWEADKPIKTMRDIASYSLLEKFEKSEPFLIHISNRAANEILWGSDISIEEYEKQAELLKPKSKVLKGVTLSFKPNVSNKLYKCRNVAGIIKGKDTTSCVVVGGHYDHLGKYNGWIWNGADDNGSGAVGVIAIARAFALSGVKPERSILFVNFSGEEKGLLGSKAFVENLPSYLKVDYMLNMDMIGRDSYKDKKGRQCPVIFSEGKNEVKELLQQVNETNSFDLELIYWPSNGKNGSSDHSPFAKKGVPYAFFWTGWHDDYHRPTDETSKINWNKMLKIVKLGYLHVWEIIEKGL